MKWKKYDSVGEYDRYREETRSCSSSLEVWQPIRYRRTLEDNGFSHRLYCPSIRPVFPIVSTFYKSKMPDNCRPLVFFFFSIIQHTRFNESSLLFKAKEKSNKQGVLYATCIKCRLFHTSLQCNIKSFLSICVIWWSAQVSLFHREYNHLAKVQLLITFAFFFLERERIEDMLKIPPSSCQLSL